MTAGLQIPPHIFKSYDIRGLVDSELSESTAELIGAATVETLGAKSLAVGRDMREHSPRIEDALVRGITGAGAHAVLIRGMTGTGAEADPIEVCSTPMSYFAAAVLDVDGAVMVTASHNPGEYNGFKFSKRGGEPMGMGTGLERVRELVLKGDVAKAEASGGRGSIQEEKDLLGRWCAHLKQYLPKVGPMKIVVDCGNGVMGPIVRRLLAEVDPDKRIDVIWLFDEPDGSFPWHPADPLTLVNLRHLEGAVLASGADFGVAFDGDGDRLAFVDEHGGFVGCDLITALFARDILSEPQNRGKMILYDLRSSRAVREEIEAAGGVADMCRVGHSHIKAAMRGIREGSVLNPSLEGDAIFAGELSGHFFFKDCFTIDTAERALLLGLKLMTEDGGSLGERVAPLRRYHHSGEVNFRFPEQGMMREVLDRVEQKYSDHHVFKLDGVSVEADSWWLNVRPSNTEPVIRLTAESVVSREALAKLLSEIEALISDSGGVRKI